MVTYGSPVHRLQHIVQTHLNWDVRMFNLDRPCEDSNTAEAQQPVPPPPPPGNPPEAAATVAGVPLHEPHSHRQLPVQHSKSMPPEMSPDQVGFLPRQAYVLALAAHGPTKYGRPWLCISGYALLLLMLARHKQQNDFFGWSSAHHTEICKQ